jgi:hypothetical protein
MLMMMGRGKRGRSCTTCIFISIYNILPPPTNGASWPEKATIEHHLPQQSSMIRLVHIITPPPDGPIRKRRLLTKAPSEAAEGDRSAVEVSISKTIIDFYYKKPYNHSSPKIT